jgi:heme/copper-type cytochrome/quinol oxidase subunit 3
MGSYTPATHPFFAVYFLITALHGLHVLGGALVLGYFAFPGAKMWKSNPEQFINRIEVGGLFWHFVDLVWIFLFPVVYLL